MGGEEEHIFDLIVEGTTLNDLFCCDTDVNTLVIDRNTTYGTSVNSFNDLLSSPYIENIKIGKGPPENTANTALILETHPFLLHSQSKVVKNFSKKPFGDTRLKYVEFSRLFFAFRDGTLLETPKDKTELVDDDLIGNVSKHVLYKAFSSGNLSLYANLQKAKTKKIKESRS